MFERDGFAHQPGLQIKFVSRDPLESRTQCGFRQSGLCKILFSKNLDTKILITDDLGTRLLASPNRHGLDHDRAILNCGARSDGSKYLLKHRLTSRVLNRASGLSRRFDLEEFGDSRLRIAFDDQSLLCWAGFILPALRLWLFLRHLVQLSHWFLSAALVMVAQPGIKPGRQ